MRRLRRQYPAYGGRSSNQDWERVLMIRKLLETASAVAREAWKRDFRLRWQLSTPGDALYRLKSRGIDPDLVIDGGAYHGLWTKTFSKLFPRAKWLVIEPQKQFGEIIRSNLKASLADYVLVNDLLYDQDGVDLDFFVVQGTDIKTGSSIYAEKKRASASTKVTSKTLDTLCAEQGLVGLKTLLKLDLQGAELDCLRGAN